MRDFGLVFLLLVLMVSILAWLSRGHESNGDTSPDVSSPQGDHSPDQPAAGGSYEYLKTHERYAVRQDGKLVIQERRRESWRTSDGWSWARQTGFDPGSFIFPPVPDWSPVRAAPASVSAQATVIHDVVSPVADTEFENAAFNYVSSLLGAETIPSGALPLEHRRSLVEALALNAGVTVDHGVADPAGRPSLRVSFTDLTPVADSTQSFFLDDQYIFLAATFVGFDDEGGFRIVEDRRAADAIPAELLTLLGSERTPRFLRP